MSDDQIEAILGRQVLDSRGTPTVEVEVRCVGGAVGRAIVPSGASTGRHEAVELRDGDPLHYQGKGVRLAVRHVNEVLAPLLLGMPALEQEDIDRKMIDADGTPNKSVLGANAILGVSMTCAHGAAVAAGKPLWQHLLHESEPLLPLPMVNLISGGLHAGRNLEFQDFLFLPVGARSYSESLEMTVAVYRALSETLKQAGYEGVLVGDEGGFGPKLSNNEQAVELILQAFQRVGLAPGRDAGIALDVASTHFHRQGRYHLENQSLTAAEFSAWLARWAAQYPILSIEDGMAEDDWDGWKTLTQSLGKSVQLIGDDLFVTNPRRLQEGVERGVANCVLVKVNQIGTLTETFEVLAMAKKAGYRAVVSARSGETEDTTLADLAVASGAGQIKIGSIARSERLAKYNQLLRIEEQLGASAPFARWGRN